jgi:hypothetical protein
MELLLYFVGHTFVSRADTSLLLKTWKYSEKLRKTTTNANATTFSEPKAQHCKMPLASLFREQTNCRHQSQARTFWLHSPIRRNSNTNILIAQTTLYKSNVGVHIFAKLYWSNDHLHYRAPQFLWLYVYVITNAGKFQATFCEWNWKGTVIRRYLFLLSSGKHKFS